MIWTDKIAWLEANKDAYKTRQDILDAFNKQFKVNAPIKQFNSAAKRYGVKLPTSKIYWTKDKLDWLKSQLHLTTPEIAKLFNETFNANVKTYHITSALYRYNLSCKVSSICWVDKLDWIRDAVKRYDDKEDLLKDLNDYFSIDATFAHLDYIHDQYNIKIPVAKRLVEASRKQLAEREGHLVGTEVTNNRGHILLKLKDKWVIKSRYIYEQYHNVTLTDTDFIIFLDGDGTNFNINNLYKVSGYVHLHMATNGYYKLDRLPIIKTLEWKELLNDNKQNHCMISNIC